MSLCDAHKAGASTRPAAQSCTPDECNCSHTPNGSNRRHAFYRAATSSAPLPGPSSTMCSCCGQSSCCQAATHQMPTICMGAVQVHGRQGSTQLAAISWRAEMIAPAREHGHSSACNGRTLCPGPSAACLATAVASISTGWRKAGWHTPRQTFARSRGRSQSRRPRQTHRAVGGGGRGQRRLVAAAAWLLAPV